VTAVSAVVTVVGPVLTMPRNMTPARAVWANVTRALTMWMQGGRPRAWLGAQCALWILEISSPSKQNMDGVTMYIRSLNQI
jgi:hypothetical protein